MKWMFNCDWSILIYYYTAWPNWKIEMNNAQQALLLHISVWLQIKSKTSYQKRKDEIFSSHMSSCSIYLMFFSPKNMTFICLLVDHKKCTLNIPIAKAKMENIFSIADLYIYSLLINSHWWNHSCFTVLYQEGWVQIGIEFFPAIKKNSNFQLEKKICLKIGLGFNFLAKVTWDTHFIYGFISSFTRLCNHEMSISQN